MVPFGSFVERQKRIFGTISKGEDPRKKFYQDRRSSSWRWEEKEAARSDPWTPQRRSDPAVAVARPRTSGSWKLGDLLVAETESEVEAPLELIQVLIRQALRPRDAVGSLLSAVRPVHVPLERHPAALPRPYLLLHFHRRSQRSSVGHRSSIQPGFRVGFAASEFTSGNETHGFQATRQLVVERRRLLYCSIITVPDGPCTGNLSDRTQPNCSRHRDGPADPDNDSTVRIRFIKCKQQTKKRQ
ncbi:hypothetical protein C4D60_Mb11t16990 [Musa balbisiana]|uniref:Uncharacterized protein n=1 Tax=Musa balbisiana TaxID=52838 RepID=A0A4S8J770_MUSBA|nr:hypothetical protein C4D60_Mb11t16990 [Musa balbisiana]